MLANEHLKAKAWRINAGLSVEQLAALSGYSYHAIYAFERGSKPKGRNGAKTAKDHEISDWVWHRYRMCCAGVQAQLSGTKFKW